MHDMNSSTIRNGMYRFDLDYSKSKRGAWIKKCKREEVRRMYQLSSNIKILRIFDFILVLLKEGKEIFNLADILVRYDLICVWLEKGKKICDLSEVLV